MHFHVLAILSGSWQRALRAPLLPATGLWSLHTMRKHKAVYRIYMYTHTCTCTSWLCLSEYLLCTNVHLILPFYFIIRTIASLCAQACVSVVLCLHDDVMVYLYCDVSCLEDCHVYVVRVLE